MMLFRKRSKQELEKQALQRLQQSYFLQEEIERYLVDLPRDEHMISGRFLATKEKAFFHWQKKFLDDLEIYLAELTSFDQLRLWLVLLEQKSGAIAIGRFSRERAGYLVKRIQRIYAKKTAVIRATSELRRDTQMLSRELAEWDITRANREAAGSFADLRVLAQDRGPVTLGGYFKRFGRYLCAISLNYFQFREKTFLLDQKQQNEKLKKLAFKVH